MESRWDLRMESRLVERRIVANKPVLEGRSFIMRNRSNLSLAVACFVAFISFASRANTCSPNPTPSNAMYLPNPSFNPQNGYVHVAGFDVRGGQNMIVVRFVESSLVPGCFFDSSTVDGKATLALLISAYLTNKQVSVSCWGGATWHSDFDNTTDGCGYENLAALSF
jgi:hypothetical protein